MWIETTWTFSTDTNGISRRWWYIPAAAANRKIEPVIDRHITMRRLGKHRPATGKSRESGLAVRHVQGKRHEKGRARDGSSEGQ